ILITVSTPVSICSLMNASNKYVRATHAHEARSLNGMDFAISSPRSPASLRAKGSRNSASDRSVSRARYTAAHIAVSEIFRMGSAIPPTSPPRLAHRTLPSPSTQRMEPTQICQCNRGSPRALQSALRSSDLGDPAGKNRLLRRLDISETNAHSHERKNENNLGVAFENAVVAGNLDDDGRPVGKRIGEIEIAAAD